MTNVAPVNGTEVPQVVPLFVAGAARVRSIPLDYPLEHHGAVYDRIVITRLTGAEVAAFMERLADEPENSDARKLVAFPMFFRPVGDSDEPDRDAPVPLAVMLGLDDDDSQEVVAAALPLLPRRFRADAGSEPAPETGEA